MRLCRRRRPTIHPPDQPIAPGAAGPTAPPSVPAKRIAVDVLEDEAHRRAVEGWEEPAGWYRGEPGGYVRRYSDTLLIFKLKGELPQKYAERVQMSGGLATLNLEALPDDLLERIARGEHPMAVLASAVERGLSRKELGLLPAKDE